MFEMILKTQNVKFSPCGGFSQIASHISLNNFGKLEPKRGACTQSTACRQICIRPTHDFVIE